MSPTGPDGLAGLYFPRDHYNMFLLHNVSQIFKITLIWSDLMFLSQNEAENIFYTVKKAMSISNGL